METLNWLEMHVDRAVGRWAKGQPDQSPAALVASCPRGEWLAEIGERCGYSAAELAAAVRPAVLRALRVDAPAALDAAGLHEVATRLRALPDDVGVMVAAREARAAEGAAEATAAEATAFEWAVAEAAEAAAWVARCAAVAVEMTAFEWAVASAVALAAETYKPKAEHSRCADDVRAALPDLAERWAAAMEEVCE